MNEDRADGAEPFFSRWSRVKTEAREEAASGAADAPAESAAPAPAELDAADQPPALPPVEELTLESDFKGFFHPKVDEDVRRAALRKLFSDPHFNVMDGLDVYIDDYSKSEPIPAAMLASLKQAQRIFEWAAQDTEKTEKEARARAAQQEDALAAPQVLAQDVPHSVTPQPAGDPPAEKT